MRNFNAFIKKAKQKTYEKLSEKTRKKIDNK